MINGLMFIFLEVFMEQSLKKITYREKSGRSLQHDLKLHKNYLQFMLVTSVENRLLNYSSRSLTKKRKIYQSNYVKKNEKKHQFFHEQFKTQDRHYFQELWQGNDNKPLKKINECLSIRNLSPFTKKELIQQENCEPMRAEMQREDGQLETCYLKSKMINEKLQRNKRRKKNFINTETKQKQKTDSNSKNFLISYKFPNKIVTTKVTPISSPFSMIID